MSLLHLLQWFFLILHQQLLSLLLGGKIPELGDRQRRCTSLFQALSPLPVQTNEQDRVRDREGDCALTGSVPRWMGPGLAEPGVLVLRGPGDLLLHWP